jgi:hypothetical protein
MVDSVQNKLHYCNTSCLKHSDKQTLCMCVLLIYTDYIYIYIGPGSSVGIGTGYGLDGPGIESRCGRDFFHTCRPTQGPTQPPVQRAPVLYRGKSGRSVVMTTHPLLSPRLRMRGAIPLLALYNLGGLLQGEIYLYSYIYIYNTFDCVRFLS